MSPNRARLRTAPCPKESVVVCRTNREYGCEDKELSSMSGYKLPLEGIRVIDMTVVWAGPFATVLLGDMGAELIRVDSLQYPDVNTRGQPIILHAMLAGVSGQ